MMKKVTADSMYNLYKKPKVVLTPDDIYKNGGIVQAWIQKFQDGGMAKTATGGASSGMMGGMMEGMMGSMMGSMMGGMGGMGGGNPASMILQGVSQAVGSQKKATEQQGQQSLQNAYQQQQINDLKAAELYQSQLQPYKNGGYVFPWIQKAQGGITAEELNFPTNSYPTWETIINQNENVYSRYNPNPINPEIYQLPVKQNNFATDNTFIKPSLITKDGKMPMNKDGKMIQGIGGGMMSKTNLADAVLGGINMAGDVANGALTAFAKPGSKGTAYAEGSQMAQSFVKPLENIPIVGQASKLISGIIGGALNARKQGIEDEETAKRDKQLEYLTRNTMNVNQPSYYGNYMAKYGANPKMMEQRVIDDIYSDFDKYLKLT